jgi:DNA-binding XRE family transcriptional regulator
MAETLYPERQRCKSCRKNFGKVVLDGIFCSYACAGIPTPSSNISEAPRHCKRQLDSSWGWKTQFTHEAAVPAHLRADPTSNIYRCDYCHFLHVGHSRVVVTHQREILKRKVWDEKTLGSVIQRVREEKKIERKAVAAKLKVPVYQIIEVETGSPKMSMVVVFRLMALLRLDLEVSER